MAIGDAVFWAAVVWGLVNTLNILRQFVSWYINHKHFRLQQPIEDRISKVWAIMEETGMV